MNKVLKQLKQVFLSPNDMVRLDALRENAKAVRAALDAEDEADDIVLSTDEQAVLEAHPEWAALVYEVLADMAPQDEEGGSDANAVAAKIEELLAKEDVEIGKAFSEGLLAMMPPEFSEWELWFGDLPLVEEEVHNEVRRDRTVMAGMPRTEGMAKYGLTPGIIFEACEGISMLLDRLREMAMHPDRYATDRGHVDLRKVLEWIRELQINREDVTFALSIDPIAISEQDHPVVPATLLIAEIGNTPNCPPGAAELILQWFFEIIPFAPLLFAGYEAELQREGYMYLKRDSSASNRDLYSRWSVGQLIR